MTGEQSLPRLPQRDPAGHKGTFGTVAVIGGCAHGEARMIGGPAMSALAALRSGAGLARLALPEPVLDAGLTIAASATGVPLPVDRDGVVVAHEAAERIDRMLGDCRCLAVGPGLGTGVAPAAISLRCVNQQDVPVVVDADALNNLAATPEFHRDFHASAILTPHPGEFARLADVLNIDADPTRDDERSDAASLLAQRLGCVVVLKGAGTVVSDGQRTWVDPTRDAALATAGTGDVLTGVIAGLVAQFVKRSMGAGERTITSEQRGGLGLFDAARLGVRAQALAAERWRKRSGASAGLLATDLLDELPAALESLR